MSNPEHLSQSGEHAVEKIGDAARERQAELLHSPEKTGEHSPERAAEALASARKEAHETAISVEAPRHEAGKNASTHHVRQVASRRARAKAYKDIMRHTQAELTPASRTFSKVIHHPVVEQASAAIGATIARPNAILFGALFALIISGGIYAIARYYGYALSGFEAIGSFAIGWVFGMLVDFVRLAVRKN